MTGGIMAEPNLFEEMLATYPVEKRELARAVYHRFADGDSEQFFTQLFLVLDVYAHYVERIPTRMISANADSLASMQEMREEIGLLAKTIESRDVSITSHAEKTNELCLLTLDKCKETIAAIEATVKNLGTHVDTKAIVQGVNAALQSGINREVIAPFIKQTEKLAQEVRPALEEIRESAFEVKSEMVKTHLADGLDDLPLLVRGSGHHPRYPDLSGILRPRPAKDGGPNCRRGAGDEI